MPANPVAAALHRSLTVTDARSEHDRRAERARVFSLLQEHAWNTTAFQLLEPDFRYFFAGDDGCVGYVDTGSAWVAGGAPICPLDRLEAVVERFTRAASAEGRRAAFFAVEKRFLDAIAMNVVTIGEQPWWDPLLWSEKKRQSRSLREQLRRARAKNVVIEPLHSGEVDAYRAELDTLISRWLSSRRMPRMSFLVDVQPFDFAESRRYYIAIQGDRLIGLLVAVPVYGRNGWFIEDLIRDPSAVNGTSESLIDAAFSSFAGEGSRYATLGLAPLSGDVGSLALVKKLAAGLYDFEGLRAFKSKLRPDGWAPIYLAYPNPQSTLMAIYDTLSAFSRGRPFRFGAAAMLTATPFTLRMLSLLLVIWTALLAARGRRWFRTSAVHIGWIAFDIGLTAVLFGLSRRWRQPLAIGAALALAGDSAVTLREAARLRQRGLRRKTDSFILGAAVLAPLLAVAVLAGGILRHRSRANESR